LFVYWQRHKNDVSGTILFRHRNHGERIVYFLSENKVKQVDSDAVPSSFPNEKQVPLAGEGGGYEYFADISGVNARFRRHERNARNQRAAITSCKTVEQRFQNPRG